MNVGVLLHLYQPPTQTESVFKQICSESYFPLLKLIKNNPNYHFTLNVPLSLLELMDKYGHRDWIKDLRDLYEAEKIEIVGSAAYHALLTKIPATFVDQQIILNEYGLGYYLGSKQGFEGEDSILIKNLKGFFSPELCIDSSVVKKVSDLGYEWLLADRCSVPQEQTLMLGQNIYKYKDQSALLVIRDHEISNMLSFKRDSISDDIIEKINKKAETADSLVIALDGEAFGHHNKEGLFLLEEFLDRLLQKGHVLTTISELIDEAPVEDVVEIYDSNWSEVTCSKDSGSIYNLWKDKENDIQKSLWYIQENVLKSYEKVAAPEMQSGYENIAVWLPAELSNIPQPMRSQIELMVIVNKSLHSDQFWWASGQFLYDKTLFSPLVINKALDYYKEISARLDDKDLIYLVAKKSEDIEKLIQEKNN